MELGSIKSGHLNRRKAGRFSPLLGQGYTLHINGVNIKLDHLADIGPEGLKIMHRCFKDFSLDKSYTVKFKRHGRVLFSAPVKLRWHRDFKHPMNMRLLGFEFKDDDMKLAQFWVQDGYQGKRFKEQVANDYRPLLRFHKLLFEKNPATPEPGTWERIATVVPEYGMPVILLMLFISAVF